MAGQAYRFLVCGPSGTPIAEASGARVRQHTQLLNGVHSATIALPLTDPTALGLTPGTGRLKIYRSPSSAQLAAAPGTTPSLIFYGQLPATNVMLDTGSSADTDGLVTAVYQDPRWRLANMFTLGTETYASTDQGAILWDLVNKQNLRTGGDTYMLQGGVTTGILRTRDFTLPAGSGQVVVQSRFDEMAALDGGCDFDVTPIDGSALSPTPTMQMGTLNVYLKQGTNRTNAVFALGSDLKSNVSQITLSYAPLVTFSTHTGTDTNGQLISSTAGTPSAVAGQYGLIEQLQNDARVSDSTTLLSKSVADIALMSGLRPIITISNPLPDAPAAFEDYFLGDTIYVSCRKGSLVLNYQPLRIHGIDLVVDDVGHENVTLTTSPQ
jgi:hypothetical protein